MTMDVIPELAKLLIVIRIANGRELLCTPLNDIFQESGRIALSAERYSGDDVRDGGQSRTPSAHFTERRDSICIVHAFWDFMDPGLRVPNQMKCVILCLLCCEGLSCDTRMTISINFTSI